MGVLSASRLKSVDFYRKIPRDLTEATLHGASISIIAAVAMVLLFITEFSTYLSVQTTTAVVIDRSLDGDLLRINFNLSFPSLSCEFASLDVTDAIGANRINLTKTLKKFPINENLVIMGEEFGDRMHEKPAMPLREETLHEDVVNHGSWVILLNSRNFQDIVDSYPILLVNFHAPWCPWCQRLAPVWENAALELAKKYPPADGRVRLANVDCTVEEMICRDHHIQGFPSIRIFRKADDDTDGHKHHTDIHGDDMGRHEHESYYGERTVEAFVHFADNLISALPARLQPLALPEAHVEEAKRVVSEKSGKAPKAAGCHVQGFVLVKKVPGTVHVTAHSPAQSLHYNALNMSHIIQHWSFGRKLTDQRLKEVQRLMPEMHGRHLWEDRLEYTRFVSSFLNTTHEHYMQVVLTTVETSVGHRHNAYEYTAHSHSYGVEGIPSAKFSFNPSPFQVVVVETRRSFLHFITMMCAIIGGVFTVAGIADSIIYSGINVYKKLELGKLN